MPLGAPRRVKSLHPDIGHTALLVGEYLTLVWMLMAHGSSLSLECLFEITSESTSISVAVKEHEPWALLMDVFLPRTRGSCRLYACLFDNVIMRSMDLRKGILSFIAFFERSCYHMYKEAT